MMAENVEITSQVLKAEKIDHYEHVMEHLQSFYQDKSMCDVTLTAGNYSVQAHRVVLAANSDYFSAMFSRNWSERKDSNITLHDLKPCGLKAVVEFSYYGNLIIDSENIGDVLSAIHHCQLVKAYRLFEDFLGKNIDKFDVSDLLTLSDVYGLKTLHQDLVSFTALELMPLFCDISNACTDVINQIGGVPPDFFREVLTVWKGSAIGFGQVAVFDVVMKWIRFDFDERGKYLSELLSSVSEDAVDVAKVVRYCQLTSAERRQEAENGGPSFITAVKHFTGNACDTLVAYNGHEAIPRNISSIPVLGMDSWEYCLFDLDTELYFIYGNPPVTKYATKCAGCYKYDSCLDRWFPIQRLPSSRRRFSTVAFNRKLMVLGGLNDKNETLNTVDVYDPVSNAWSEGVPLMVSLYGHAATTCQEHIYISGGCMEMHGKCLNKLFRFDPEKSSWFEKEPMIAARRGHGLVAYNDCLYQFGGSNDIYETPDPKLEYYNLSHKPGKWTNLNLFGIAQNPCGIHSSGDCMYFCIVDWDQNDSLVIFKYDERAQQLVELHKTSTSGNDEHIYKNFCCFKIPRFVYTNMTMIEI
jgi:hypothetical protein